MRRKKTLLLKEAPLAQGCLDELPPEIAPIVRQAAARIDAFWIPKGVHFGWERAFRNKGKFPAWMSKAEACVLVQRVLLEAPLRVFANRREGSAASGEYRVVADAGDVIATRGQAHIAYRAGPRRGEPQFLRGPGRAGKSRRKLLRAHG